MTSPADGQGELTPDVHAVSPADQSSDRAQSDADNASAVRSRGSARDQAASNQRALSAQLDAMTALSAQHVVDLVRASREQTASSERVASATEQYTQAMLAHQERAKLAARRYRITIVVLVGFFVALLIRQEVANRASQDARRTLLDCIVPTGTCYKHSQERTAKVVGSVNRFATLAAACAPNFTGLPLGPRIDAIQHCILHHLH